MSLQAAGSRRPVGLSPAPAAACAGTADARQHEPRRLRSSSGGRSARPRAPAEAARMRRRTPRGRHGASTAWPAARSRSRRATAGSTAASARWAASSSPTPTRAPSARIVAASRPSWRGQRARPARQTPSSTSRSRTRSMSSRTFSATPSVSSRCVVAERQQRLRPGDRLAHARQLVQLLAAQAGNRGAHAPGDLVGHAGQARAHDLGLALGRGVVDPVVEAAALQRVVQLARAVRRDHDERAARAP